MERCCPLIAQALSQHHPSRPLAKQVAVKTEAQASERRFRSFAAMA